MHWQSDALTTTLDLIRTTLDIIRTKLDLINTTLDLICITLDLIRTTLDLIHTRLDLICVVHLIGIFLVLPRRFFFLLECYFDGEIFSVLT
jgi:hypothetical protein